MNVVTRFAPSPTGYLHIGGVRTALYSYLWAKKNNGKFLLRIEDTDQTRYQPEAESSIYDGLKWLGINWEGDIIRQSTRTAVYQQHAEQLLKAGKAYYCFCTAERLELMRDIQRKKGRAPKYDKTCLRLEPELVQQRIASGEAHVVRLNIAEEGIVRVHDLVRGDIDFQCQELDDQVLLKSDGFPTYHLANVVDDHAAQITHVIRGEEWIPSTPKHVLLYQAFGWEQPVFAHLSLFINKGGGKLSKRQGAMSILEYKHQGYLPEAIINFIALLGWNPKTTQEVFTMAELVEAFDLTQINRANPIFDTDKLDWYNGQYIRRLPLEQIVEQCRPYLPETAELSYVIDVVKLEYERLKRFSDITQQTDFFFVDQLTYPVELLTWKQTPTERTRSALTAVHEQLATVTQWTKEELERVILPWIAEAGYTNGEVLWPVRAALTGKRASPSPFEVAAVLGKTRALARLQQAISALSQ